MWVWVSYDPLSPAPLKLLGFVVQMFSKTWDIYV